MKSHSAFTLIELLCVILIIAILAAICARPTARAFRECRARFATAQGINYIRIDLALQLDDPDSDADRALPVWLATSTLPPWYDMPVY